jgi:hypothetical protein
MSKSIVARLRFIRERVGKVGLIEAALHPLLTPVFIMPAWFRSLWASRVLLFGQWGRYHGFHPQNALNSFFYKTQWLNIERYGRHGVSGVVGLGDYPLSRWFHLSMLSSCLYANAGAATTLLGTLIWASLHLVWLDVVSWTWVLGVTAVFFFSSTAFAMAFTRQNYNILGWMWVPLALYAVLNGQWALAALVWLAASLASITVIFAAIPLMAAHAWSSGDVEAILSLLPAITKLGLHLLPTLSKGGPRTALLNIAKLIGLMPVGVRYKRTSMRFGVFNLYLIGLYGIGCGILWWAQKSVPTLPLTALVLFVVNQHLIRFADYQSVILLFVTVFAAWLMVASPSVLGLVALAVVVNPLPAFFGLCSIKRDRTMVRTQARQPFDHSRLQTGLETFLGSVPTGSRIYFAFEDPRGVYENLFDGYRNILELPLFIAASRGVHLFPDWYAVTETNYEGAPNCWGRTPESVLDNANRWGAAYAVVYQDSGTNLEDVWIHAGFRETACFDWGDWERELDGHHLWASNLPPRWYLLSIPAQ